MENILLSFAIFIKAINPGYTIDGHSNVGEFIELARAPENSENPETSSDVPLSLAGLSISYTNSSGNSVVLYEFPENSWMTGDTILLRLASSPEAASADLNYSKTLALSAGPLTLKLNDKIIDSVCWTGKNDCLPAFSASQPTTLVRNPISLDFSHESAYSPTFDATQPGYYVEAANDEILPRECHNLRFSEILSYYETAKSEQFIEFYNPTADPIILDNCQIKYKNKFYSLSGTVQPDAYFVRLLSDFSLTKNPTTSNIIELIDADNSVADTLTYYNGQKKATSYAMVGYDANGDELWYTTYHPTPGEPNIYQEYRTCEAGKVINTDTGNCVKVADETDKVCEEGKYLNPLTNRCKKYEVAEEKICDEGYYLNPDTNRCKKIKDNDGAEYSLVSTEDGKSSFVALIAVIIVAVAGLVYVVYEFRHEIKRLFDKVFRRAPHKPHPGSDRH